MRWLTCWPTRSRCRGLETVDTFNADGRALGARRRVGPARAATRQQLDGPATRCALPMWPLSGGAARVATHCRGQRWRAAGRRYGRPHLHRRAGAQGADAILMQEDCEALATAEGQGQVRINAVPAAGQWIRRAGEDITQGAVVLQAARACRPPNWAWPPSIGMAPVPGGAPPACGLVLHR